MNIFILIMAWLFLVMPVWAKDISLIDTTDIANNTTKIVSEGPVADKSEVVKSDVLKVDTAPLAQGAANSKVVKSEAVKIDVKRSDAGPRPNAPDDFERMQDFMHQEHERIKAIKILNLDLERASLELKKMETEIKLAGLSKDQSLTVTAGNASSNLSKPAVFQVAGIFLDGDMREALMNVNGTHIQVSEGQDIREGVKVKSIGAQTVVLEYADGKNETINLGS